MLERFASVLCLTVLVVVLLPVPGAALERPEFVAGELIIQFEDHVDGARQSALLDQHRLVSKRTIRGIGALLVRLPEGDSVRERAASLMRLPEIRYADPNFYRYIDAVPNDSRFGELWGLHNTGQSGGSQDADIDGPEAWEIAVGSPDVVVAVLDSGFDADHVDLADNLYVNPNEIPGNGVDDDGNGYVDDVSGWDFRDNDNNPSPSGQGCVGHGTHTGGTVGAVGNNGIGVTGVAQQVKIMPLRAFYPFLFILCTAQDSDLLEAVDYMTLMGVPVSNNSWGGGGFSNAMYEAIGRSRHLFVVSAGNSNSNNDGNPAYPASYDHDHILAVAATDRNDNRSGFSNYGATSVDVGAPGSSILSTKPNNAYGYLDGTSMAGPHVAGAAAVLLDLDPTATPHELKNRIMRGTDFVNLQVVTGGRLNLNNSLTLPAPAVTVDVEPNGATDLPPGATIEYQLTIANSSGSSRTVDVSVRLWAPTGGEIPLIGPASLTLTAGQTRSVGLSRTLPGAMPSGTYRLIGRVTDGAATYDEDVVVYTIQ